MTIAEIARENLESGVEAKVSKIVESMSKMGPFPENPDITQMGCWADDIRYNVKAMYNWHFLNIPYNPSNYPIVTPDQQENVESMITSLDETGKWTAKDPAKYNWELTYAISNLIHFFGDIHQPLHVTDFFSSQFPTGDKGGNLFMVNFGGNSTDLHGIWDSICGQYITDPSRPLDSSGMDFIQNLAQTFQATYNFTDDQKKQWNSTVMAEESYNYAVQYSYDNGNLQPGDTLSPTYLSNCQFAAEQRVTLAGYRLATELNYLFKSSTDPDPKHIHQRIKSAKQEISAFAQNKHAQLRTMRK